MGTANFLNKNAYKTYAIENCEEAEFIEEDIYTEIEKKLPKGWQMVEADEWDNERNYPAKYFGEVYQYFEFYGVEVTATLKLCIRSAYYNGCNLDYDFEFIVDGSDYETIDEVENESKTSA